MTDRLWILLLFSSCVAQGELQEAAGNPWRNFLSQHGALGLQALAHIAEVVHHSAAVFREGKAMVPVCVIF